MKRIHIEGGIGGVEYHVRGWSEPEFVNSDAIITTVRVIPGAGHHDEVHVWNRGGKAGILIVEKGDGDTIARKLLA